MQVKGGIKKGGITTGHLILEKQSFKINRIQKLIRLILF